MRPDHPAPAELLRLADAHLRSLQPAQRAQFRHGGRPYRVRFDYPGFVLVFDGVSGLLLARSLAGQPTTLATAQGVGYVASR
jgi:hypothetical protein